MGIFFRREKSEGSSRSSDDNLPGYQKPNPTGLRLFTALLYLKSAVFLVLVEIGNINDKAVIRDTYFLKIGLANVIPASVPNAVFINSIAQSIGLHDFYQVGLWNFCEGYNGQGVTYCSRPKTLYWFNPVEILLNELLAGASIALPTKITDVLHIVRVASKWMFVCYLVGTCLTFLCIFLVPMGFSKQPRWQHKAKRIFLRQLPITILSFVALLFTAGASVIATTMFVIFQNTFSGAADLNIEAHLGIPMLAFMWIATGFNLIGFLMQIGTCCGVCCCTGRRKAERKSQMVQNNKAASVEKPTGTRNNRGRFGFKRTKA
jgi:SUR7/PalI family